MDRHSPPFTLYCPTNAGYSIATDGNPDIANASRRGGPSAGMQKKNGGDKPRRSLDFCWPD
jgi:hypothetical protein